MKIFDFCKKFSPKNQKETSVGQILSVLSDEISKWRNLSDYRTMRYLFFARTAFFRRGVFSHARVRVCGHMRARTHLCNVCAFIHLLLAREERNFSCRRFMILLRSFFIRQAPKKQNCGIFGGGEQCGTIQNSGKKREIRLETTEKRLLAAMKGRYTSEKTIKRRKPAKKRGKRKKTKKN